jgi:predicted nuclease with TOPRIM domain
MSDLVCSRRLGYMADDKTFRERISELVAEERELRRRLGDHQVSRDEERARLRELETELDQCWDLLRQRDAKREFGENPDDATTRPGEVVEKYLS